MLTWLALYGKKVVYSGRYSKGKTDLCTVLSRPERKWPSVSQQDVLWDVCTQYRFYARDASASPPWPAPVWRKSVFALRTSPTRGACQLLSVPPLCQGSGASHGWRVLTCRPWGCVSHLTHSPIPYPCFYCSLLLSALPAPSRPLRCTRGVGASLSWGVSS